MVINFLAVAFLHNIMTFFIKLLLLILILGIIILVHEFGHFIWAKKFGVHIYEFSIGMGPVVFNHKGKKDNINYNIRAIPIGGFVSMAGEVYDDVSGKLPKEKLMCNKPWWQRLIILVAGVTNNFILAILLLTIYAAIWGGSAITPVISKVMENSAAEKYGLKAGDKILKINNYDVNSWDKAQIILYYKNNKEYYNFRIKHQDGNIEDIKIVPDKIKDEITNEERKVFGIGIEPSDTSNILKKISYGFKKFASIISSMVATISGLITGKISLNALSGPVGIFEVVGETLTYNKISYAFEYITYLVAFLSINVGFMNILPFPAFDGGHVLFIIIEKIKGSPVDSKIENTCHLIGFALIFLLMIIVTINDIIKLV